MKRDVFGILFLEKGSDIIDFGFFLFDEVLEMVNFKVVFLLMFFRCWFKDFLWVRVLCRVLKWEVF